MCVILLRPILLHFAHIHIFRLCFHSYCLILYTLVFILFSKNHIALFFSLILFHFAHSHITLLCFTHIIYLCWHSYYFTWINWHYFPLFLLVLLLFTHTHITSLWLHLCYFTYFVLILLFSWIRQQSSFAQRLWNQRVSDLKCRHSPTFKQSSWASLEGSDIGE